MVYLFWFTLEGSRANREPDLKRDLIRILTAIAAFAYEDVST